MFAPTVFLGVFTGNVKFVDEDSTLVHPFDIITKRYGHEKIKKIYVFLLSLCLCHYVVLFTQLKQNISIYKGVATFA